LPPVVSTRFLLLLTFAATAGAQEVVTYQIENIYNFVLPGMANYGIAQGSIFALLGTNLTTSTASQGVPLQTAFQGVEIAVTVNGATTNAIPYSVSPQRVTAILPSKTPVGDGTVTVTSGGQQTASGPIHVVQSAFGLLTVPGLNVVNVAEVQNVSQGWEPLSQANAANPGESLALWGSGLGPVSGDETQYQTPSNLTGVPIEVDIGGVSAAVIYRGRSIYPGLDQINVVIPPGVSGCHVSVVVVVSGVPSNLATIPVAPSGRICSDQAMIQLTADEYQEFLGLDSVDVGMISLLSLTTPSAVTGAATSDLVYGPFQGYTGGQITSAGLLLQPSVGSCAASSEPPFYFLQLGSRLNAGPQIAVKGPEGSLALAPGDISDSVPPGASPQIIPPTGGAFTFDNGPGGPDVGPFTATLTVNVAPQLVWTNSSAITAVNRASGQQVTWTGGIPGSYISIFGYTVAPQYSAAGSGSDVYTAFICTAPLSAGQFTIPAAVLESLMPSGIVLAQGLPPAAGGYLYVVNEITQRFSAPGLNLGLLLFGVGGGISIPFN
jgi:uncharacterized protein (TIGR03437 family)